MTVKINQCYMWDCTCGHRNISEGVPLSAENKEITKMMIHDIPYAKIEACNQYPTEVTCAECLVTHEAVS